MSAHKRWMVYGFCVLLQACAQVDDYLLGKDNTPKPHALQPIKSTVPVTEKWSISIAKSTRASGTLKLLPTVQGDTLYVAEPHGKVLAVDKKTGVIRWSTQLKQGVVSGPVVAHGVLALGTANAGLVILNQANGQERWHANLSGDVLSSPLLTEERVIAKTIDGHLYAFDLNTAKKQWDVDHGAPHLILKVSSSPVSMGNVVLVGFSDGKLDAVDMDSGRVLWQRSIAYASGSSDVERLVDIDADPIVRGDIVYLASYQGYVGAMQLANGQFAWNKPASTYKNLALDEHNLYMSDSNDTVFAFNRRDGQVQWKQTALAARGLTAPVVLGRHVLVGDKTGLLHVLDTQQGDLIARIPVGSAMDVAPTISGNRVYVLTTAGQLTCFSVGE